MNPLHGVHAVHGGHADIHEDGVKRPLLHGNNRG